METNELNNNDEIILTESKKYLLNSIKFGYIWPLVVFIASIIPAMTTSSSIFFFGSTAIMCICVLAVYFLEYKGIRKLGTHTNPTIQRFSRQKRYALYWQEAAFLSLLIAVSCHFVYYLFPDISKTLVGIYTLIKATYILCPFLYLAGFIQLLRACNTLKRDTCIRTWYEQSINKAVLSLWLGVYGSYSLLSCFLGIGIDLLINSTFEKEISLRITGISEGNIIIILFLLVYFSFAIIPKGIQWYLLSGVWKGLCMVPSHFNDPVPEAGGFNDHLWDEERDGIPTDTNRMINVNQLISAFVLIFLGWVIYYIPLDDWTIKIMRLSAWIAILAGSIKLYSTMKGRGKTAALLWLFAAIASALSAPFDTLASIGEGLNFLASAQGEMSILPDEIVDILNSVSIIGGLLYIAGTIIFMLFPPFKRMQTGWIVLLIAFVLKMLSFTNDATFILIIIIILSIGSFMILGHIYPSGSLTARRNNALLLMAIGLLYSLLILTNNDYKYIGASIIGLFIWLTGVDKIQSVGNEIQGRGCMIWYGVLMIFASFLHFIPGSVGDILAICFQIPAYIVLAVGLSRFAESKLFYSERPCGMHTIKGIMIFSLVLAVIFIIPLFGEALSGLLFSLICIPCFIIGWKNAVVAMSNQWIKMDKSDMPLAKQQESKE